MSKLKASIGLINPKSPSNVGAVMRAAGCYQAHDIFYTGERFKNAAKFHTDTQKAGLTIPLTHVDELINSVPEGTQIVCVELVEGAIALPGDALIRSSRDVNNKVKVSNAHRK